MNYVLQDECAKGKLWRFDLKRLDWNGPRLYECIIYTFVYSK